MIISPYFTMANASIASTANITYAPIGFSGSVSDTYSTTTENRVQCILPETSYVGGFCFEIANTAGAGASWTIDVMKNGISAGLSLTLSGSIKAASDFTTVLSYVAGDLIDIRISPSGNPVLAGDVRSMILFGANNALLMGTTTDIANAAWDGGSITRWPGIMGGVTDGPATGITQGMVFPSNGTLTNFYCQITNQNTGNASRKLILFVNGGSSGLNLSFTSGNLLRVDTSTIVTINSSDYATYQTPVSNAQQTWAAWSCSFIPSDATTFVPYLKGEPNTNRSSTTFPNLLGIDGTETSENNASGFRTYGNITAKSLFILAETNAGTGKSFQVDLRVDSASTLISATLTGTSTLLASDLVNTANIPQGSVFNYRGIPTATPFGVLRFVSYGLLIQWNGLNPFPSAAEPKIIFYSRTNDPPFNFYSTTTGQPMIFNL